MRIKPKWQREFESFIPVNGCIILEGNITDLQPVDSGELVSFTSLNICLRHLMGTEFFPVFFDAIDGFFTYPSPEAPPPERREEEARERLATYVGDKCNFEVRETSAGTHFFRPNPGPRGGDGTGMFVRMSELVRGSVANPGQRAAFVLNLASRMRDFCTNDAVSAEVFGNLMKFYQEAYAVDIRSNRLVLVVDTARDIPDWFFTNNAGVRVITIPEPDRELRRLFLSNQRGVTRGAYAVLGDEGSTSGNSLIALSEGMKCAELRGVLTLAHNHKIQPDEIQKAYYLFRHGIKESPWDKLGSDFSRTLHNTLHSRVKGQDAAISGAEQVLLMAASGISGLEHSNAAGKPRGVLFFNGPTGTGKTELAKAIAACVFGDESSMIRLDMSEYASASDTKLFGAPPGYVGYQAGGKLTNEVKKRPFSVLLLDEIDKADPSILDLLLQLLEDGRMTTGQGETVSFRECIIIFTANIGLTKPVLDSAGYPVLGVDNKPKRIPAFLPEDPRKEDSPDFIAEVESTLRVSVKDFFIGIGRPELLNRIGNDNILVFGFIQPAAAREICRMKLDGIISQLKTQKGVEIKLTESAQAFLEDKAVIARVDGGRGVGNMLRSEFLKPLGLFLAYNNEMTGLVEVDCPRDSSELSFERKSKENEDA